MSGFSGFVTICLFGIALAAPSPDDCPDVKTKADFDITKFLGRWYTVKGHNFENHVHCGTADYTMLNKTNIKFLHSQFDTITEITVSWDGRLVQMDPKEPGKLTMKFSWTPEERNYWILDTDYVTYAIIYECRKIESSTINYVWILTRTQNDFKTALTNSCKIRLNRNVKLDFKSDQMACMP